MVRIAGVDVPNNKRIDIALRSIYGIGPTVANRILQTAAIDGTPKPKTEEQWWAMSARPTDRAQWLRAHFVETSGLFQIIRVDETEHCSNCGGQGFVTSQSSDGGSSSSFCVQCNGSGNFRKVIYR